MQRWEVTIWLLKVICFAEHSHPSSPLHLFYIYYLCCDQKLSFKLPNSLLEGSYVMCLSSLIKINKNNTLERLIGTNHRPQVVRSRRPTQGVCSSDGSSALLMDASSECLSFSPVNTENAVCSWKVGVSFFLPSSDQFSRVYS